jgi:hypothetical protein
MIRNQIEDYRMNDEQSQSNQIREEEKTDLPKIHSSHQRRRRRNSSYDTIPSTRNQVIPRI